MNLEIRFHLDRLILRSGYIIRFYATCLSQSSSRGEDENFISSMLGGDDERIQPGVQYVLPLRSTLMLGNHSQANVPDKHASDDLKLNRYLSQVDVDVTHPAIQIPLTQEPSSTRHR
jgi:hypothetical protein